jgi:Calcineurin-like phosphoesterase
MPAIMAMWERAMPPTGLSRGHGPLPQSPRRLTALALCLCCLLLLLCLAACAGKPPAESVFDHGIAGGPTPWTHAAFDNADDKFTFAIFSDLTGGERPGVFAVAVEQLRLLRPELILSVGDLIEGGTADRAQLAREWDSFDERAERARAPVFRTGGNHDLINPVMWDVWEQRYGRRYYHFVYRDTLFLVLDTEDNPPEFQQHISDIREESDRVVAERGWDALPETAYGQLEERKTGRVSAEQAAYFEGVIARYEKVRHTFLLMHKPAWERPGEENFARIEAALADRPYTVFHGHVHAYGYEQRHGRDYIRLATTGGVQIEGAEKAFDHVTLVTVSAEGVDIANLRLDGILDKTGRIPAGGEALCFERAVCGEPDGP